jgi:type II secretory pathway component GspD/PulD (secretin)
LAHSGFTATRLNSGKVLVLGGWVYDPAVNNFITWPDSHVVNTARLVDPSNGSMVATAGLETARAGHTATLLNDGRVLVLGGTDSDRRVVPTIEFWSETN